VTKERSYAWVLVGLLWVVAFLNYVDRQVIFSLFPPLRAEFQLSSVQLGLLSTAFLWVYAVLSPLGGFLADRFGRQRVILVSLAVWSAVTWVTGHARSFEQLLAARAAMGISEACYLPAALALIADHHTERTRSLATGIHLSGLYAGMALGGAAGARLGQQYGWRFVFTLLGAVGVVYAAVLVFGLKEGRAMRAPRRLTVGKPRLLRSLGELLFLPGFLVLTAVGSMAAMAYWIVYTWLPLYLYEAFRMSLAEAGFSATFFIQTASMAGILFGGWMADRWSGNTRRGRLYTQVIGLLAAGPFLFLAGSTTSRAFLVAGLIVFGIGRGFYDCNTMPVFCQIIRPGLRATGYGIFNFACCLVGGLMAAAAGALKDTAGLGGALRISAVVLVGAGLLLLRSRLAPEPEGSSTRAEKVPA